MSVYTVHIPPSTRRGSASGPERFVFVRDGFSWWAFLLAPLWMLWHRMWLGMIGYVVGAGAIEGPVRVCGAAGTPATLIGILLGLLVGLEAGTLRRFTLSRRGWKNLGVISGDDLEDAERRFFVAWLRRTSPPSSGPHAPMPGSASAAPNRRGPLGSDVIGLFPEPGASR